MDLDIAVIGFSGRFPGAKTLEEFWENLRSGVESICFFSDDELLAAGIAPDILSDPHYVKAAPILADVDRFDARLFGYTPREACSIDPQQRIFLECARESLEVAGYDPAKFDRPIGVYGGSTISSYLLFGDLLPQLRSDYLATVLGNDKDFLSTRVSYKLDLTGPSITVQTACSTSLVAVHMACQGLLSLDCDIALAGGISVRVPQKAGYFYQKGGVLSPDGHCRAFDSGAMGTVFGSGAGVVVLKRLVDALADGDTVHAVIKGSAVNNDGSSKADFAAPSVIGQSRSIVEAISRAGINAESITYVEAHGTGTRLGDPIEISALSTAFRAFTSRKEFCAVGSVKTNIGHADVAAGVIGLIKAILAVKHREIPPSLHYHSPNPEIDFPMSPFCVNNELVEWEACDSPLRAGINSLGMGGTNAFVVIEEAPTVGPSGRPRFDQLIQVSAKTASALAASTSRLAEHLVRHPDINLADVAYTLQVGRKDMEYRRVVVCRDTADAVALLRSPDGPSVGTARQKPALREVAFLFPGQGTQYTGMASGLYRTERVFRENVDRCCDILQPILSRDLREILYPNRSSAHREADLDRTEFAQPALFVVEYALARLWISWGLHPMACIGHSLGECVAACISDVVSLEDALSLVALRGRLMQRLPPGLMLALPLSEQEVQPYLNSAISLAAVNGPALVVVSGPAATIAGLEDRLARNGIRCYRLQTSCAFHSAAVDSILDGLMEHVQRICLAIPKIPYISNVTGTWITDEEALDPSYWARQTRKTVRFAEGIQELLGSTDGVLLEVGPGHTLGNFAKRYTRPPAERIVLASLRDSRATGSDRAFLLETVGKLWLSGIGVDAHALHAGQQRHRVVLPTYPFERERYWVDSVGTAGGWIERWPSRVRDPDPAAAGADEDHSNGRPGGALSDHHDRVTDSRSSGAVGIGSPSDGSNAEPRTPVEGAIATLWRSVLQIDRIGVDDDFFALGGTSVLIPEVLSRLNELFQVDLPALTLLESPTIAGLARCVEDVYLLEQGRCAFAGQSDPRRWL
jgi:phthiocerol/phenolphthiocerol synthesis type-I polyketide synthase E